MCAAMITAILFLVPGMPAAAQPNVDHPVSTVQAATVSDLKTPNTPSPQTIKKAEVAERKAQQEQAAKLRNEEAKSVAAEKAQKEAEAKRQDKEVAKAAEDARQAEAAKQAEAARQAEAAKQATVQPQNVRVDVDLPDHPVARDCQNPAGGTSQCQGAIDQGGLVRVTDGNGAVWFAGHNITESWILNLNVGDSVKVGGQNFKVVSMTSIPYYGQNVAHGQFDGDWFLQTCEFDNNAARVVVIQPY